MTGGAEGTDWKQVWRRKIGGGERGKHDWVSKLNVIIHIKKEHPYIEHPPVLTAFERCFFNTWQGIGFKMELSKHGGSRCSPEGGHGGWMLSPRPNSALGSFGVLQGWCGRCQGGLSSWLWGGFCIYISICTHTLTLKYSRLQWFT